MDELTLFDDNPLEWLDAYIDPMDEPDDDHTKTPQEKFDEYHRQNPHVLDALIRMTDQAIAQGHKRIGIALIYNALRWESMIATTGDEYKLNSNYQPRYVRLIEEVRPDLIGVFQKRELRS